MFKIEKLCKPEYVVNDGNFDIKQNGINIAISQKLISLTKEKLLLQNMIIFI